MKVKKIVSYTFLGLLWVIPFFGLTQSAANRELKLALNQDGSNYIKATLTTQVWGRYIDNNAGTTLNGYNKPQSYDIGLRRIRAQFYGKFHPKVFFYTQLGINNQNANNARKPGIFFHDVLTEYQLTQRSIQLGMGLTAWTGFGRYSAPGVASILGCDVPLYQQSTNDVTDQFLRKLSIYAKGKLGKLDYRWVFSDPMSVQTAGTAVKPLNAHSDFSQKPAKLQSSAYVMWQFLDEESNLTPYMTGSYLGKKRVFNIGAGYQYQSKAMWHVTDTLKLSSSTQEEDLLNYHVDVFYDAPVGKKGAALTVYAAATHMGFGKKYLRNAAVMNAADAASKMSLNGGGNGAPLYGTGNVVYAQVGYLLPAIGKNEIHLQPYVQFMQANYDALAQPMQLFDVGINYFIDGHRSKITIDYQNRPDYQIIDSKVGSRKSAIILQLQVAI